MTRRQRILVAEDEPRIASFLEKGLRAAGYGTRVATEVDETIGLGGTGRFALVILDLRPADATEEVLRQLERIRPELPVILLTGTTPRGRSPESLATACIRKPFGLDELLARVREHVQPTSPLGRDALRPSVGR